MKSKSLLLTALGAVAVLAPALAPRSLHGQAGADDALYTPVITEVVKQQAQIIDNQTKIDEALAVITEDLRIARIYASRSGGNAR
jgi:hypothetical protein